MRSFYNQKDPIIEIEYVRDMYEAQLTKIKQEEYVKDLLFADFVRKVTNNKSRYDFMEGIFREAMYQCDKKKKSERSQLTTIEDFVREDFFNNDKNFKITEIISGGFENYNWHIGLEGYGQIICICIPNMNSITTENIEYAYDGMFVFAVRESSVCSVVKKRSYKIEEIAEYIKEYFKKGQ